MSDEPTTTENNKSCIDINKIKIACLWLSWFLMSLFSILKNNEKATNFKLPKDFDYIFISINGILLFVAMNINRIENIVLNYDDKKLLEEISQKQDIINENMSVISSRQANTEPIMASGEFLQIPRNILNYKNRPVQVGDYIIQIQDTARE